MEVSIERNREIREDGILRLIIFCFIAMFLASGCWRLLGNCFPVRFLITMSIVAGGFGVYEMIILIVGRVCKANDGCCSFILLLYNWFNRKRRDVINGNINQLVSFEGMSQGDQFSDQMIDRTTCLGVDNQMKMVDNSDIEKKVETLETSEQGMLRKISEMQMEIQNRSLIVAGEKITKLKEKNQAIINYTINVLSGHLLENDIMRLCIYIQYFVNDISDFNYELIKIGDLRPFDLYHWGANINDYIVNDIDKSREKMSNFLCSVFEGKGFENSKLVYKKMKDKDDKDKIPLDINIGEYVKIKH